MVEAVTRRGWRARFPNLEALTLGRPNPGDPDTLAPEEREQYEEARRVACFVVRSGAIGGTRYSNRVPNHELQLGAECSVDISGLANPNHEPHSMTSYAPDSITISITRSL